MTPPAVARRLPWITAALCVAGWCVLAWSFVAPGRNVGNDFSYFFPRLLDLAWWRWTNGLLAVPWFSPSFCGGLPIFADGQDLSYALPGLLAPWVDPRVAVYVTAVVFALLGGAGFARLLSRCFGASAPTALLGGVVVALNGAFTARFLAGHLAYHGMMAIPWACDAVLAPLPDAGPARTRAFVRDACVAALALGYVVWGGLLNLCVPLFMGAAAVMLAQHLARGGSMRGKLLRLVVGGLLALALGAAKGAAFAAYFSHFPRDGYPLPGIPGVGRTVLAAAQSVFGVGEPWQTPVANARWVIEPHEWDYAVGPIPAIGLVALAVHALRTRLRPRTTAAWAQLAALALLLAAPIAINVYTPSWNAFLKRIPVLSSSSHLVRWWLAYLFAAPLGVLALERVSAPRRPVIASLAMTAVLALVVLRPRPDTLVARYNPDDVVAAWHAHHPRAVRELTGFKARTLQRNSALVRGASQLHCYEPAFGYARERFPRGALHEGPLDDAPPGTLNLKNPACYLWPAENACTPGSPFTAAQVPQARAFVARRRWTFATSTRQRVAWAVTAAAWAALFGALLWLARPLRPTPSPR